MTDPWQKRWDDRYSATEYAFGLEPNVYFKEQLEKLQPGKILFGAEGEGRNAIFAANLGWKVSAFDISAQGRKKALQLAEAHGVDIDYQVGELPTLDYQEGEFDAIALVYAHFPPEIKSTYHRMLSTYLRKGGTIIIEAFGKNHLEYKSKNPGVGGPGNLDSLFSIGELRTDFPDYEIIEAEEKIVELQEGLYHNGLGSVIRFVAQKK
ncbi:class I SAM-dependent methyltransferase [Pseudozobellia thermophila]|uniref:Tellurite resistance protein TehB n=1 Tax=Pseudozobellia thermophila TaxID=192903 RepID=A0A1M6M093_9FLAO|nr:class I SAM-dependent methyltransferase [Pseudozobellia thermophila]SHJ76855.1 Tellurite resistance protein TehB [Pseudozobellia thermophila]